jgi:uncharacterized protein with HEPN domain
MSRDFQLYLADIQMACEKVLRYTDGMSFEQFVEDDRTFDAVIRNLQIIGEAVKNVSIHVRDRHPDIEWRKIAGLRDILAHSYFQIENEIIWDVVQTKINSLLTKVSQLLENREDS